MNKILNRSFSLKKNVFGLGLVVLLMCSGSGLSAAELLDSLHDVALADSINQFETLCFDSAEISISRYLRGLGYYDQMIDHILRLAQQSPDSNYPAIAYRYLERKKNLRLLALLSSGYWPGLSQRPDPNERLSMALNQLRVTTKSGSSLLNAMKVPIDLEAIQKNCPDDKQVIINFWLAQDRIVAFVVSRDSLSVVQWPFSRALIEHKMKSLMAPFYTSSDPLKLDFSPKAAHDLYKLLFKPLEANLRNVKSICLIPDEMLFGFPFELLLCSSQRFNSGDERVLYQNLASLDYLIRHYAISYNYSTALLALINEPYRSVKALRHRLLTISEPMLPNSLATSEAKPWSHFTLRNDYETEEIKRVSRLLFRHDNLRQNQANKVYFLTVAGNYRWIHLTLPVLLDNVNAFNSGIIFSPKHGDSVGFSSWLSINEVLKANFSADLLAMGNSQLQSVSYQGNPGVIALPQAFLLAGVRSVLFRLWPVNSIATSQYLAKFYWELKYKRQTASQALQQAKVASFKETFMVDSREVSRAHPFFWAGFQLIGNPQISPPSPTKLPPMAVIGIAYVTVILVSFVITRKTMSKRTK